MTPRILLLDIETAPAIAYVFERWDTSIRPEQVKEEGFVLCAVGQFLGDPKYLVATNASHPKNLHDDRETVYQVWKWLNEADVVVAHNGQKFDLPVLRARFLFHGFPPPSPFKVVDTCAAAKRFFKLPYNGLNDIASHLKIGHKKHTGGLKLWKDCLAGSHAAWGKMLRYCQQDVSLLRRVYLRMRPYIANHPNLAAFSGTLCCPQCQSTRVQLRGLQVARNRTYRRFQCQSCGAWGRGQVADRGSAPISPG